MFATARRKVAEICSYVAPTFHEIISAVPSWSPSVYLVFGGFEIREVILSVIMQSFTHSFCRLFS
jgi:hypothetical protein